MSPSQYQNLLNRLERSEREIAQMHAHLFPRSLSDARLIMFPVSLNQVGGSAGSASVECSYTYAVNDMNGVTISTELALSTSRHIVAAMTAATHGMAFYDNEGTLTLWWCDEQEQTESCS